MPTIKLLPNDKDEPIEVNVNIACVSLTIKELLENLGMEEGEEEVIPLPNVNDAILRKIIQWMTHHKDDLPPAEDGENYIDGAKVITKWDADFLKVDQKTLFELMSAANYLNIEGLLDSCCKTVAEMITDSENTEEIRSRFNIVNDFTSDEEEQVRKQFKWCQEL